MVKRQGKMKANLSAVILSPVTKEIFREPQIKWLYYQILIYGAASQIKYKCDAAASLAV